MKFPVHIAVFLGLGLFFTHCDRVINPFEETVGTYSVYGAIELDQDSNFVRVRDVTIPFLSDTTGYEDLKVYFQLPDGSRKQLEKRIRTLRGNNTFNYVIREPLEPRKEYTVILEDDTNAPTIANAITPGLSYHTVKPDTADGCFQKIRFTFHNVLPTEYIIAEAGVNFNGNVVWGTVKSVEVPTHETGTDKFSMFVSVNNLMVDIFPPPPEATIGIPPVSWLPSIRCYELESDEMYLRYIHFGKGWEIFQEVGFFEEELLESGTVENGLGFFGAIKRGMITFYSDRPTPSGF
jgi:hypothetical protein